MQQILCVLLVAAAVLAGVAPFAAAQSATKVDAAGAPNAEAMGWRLGCQAYSFNRFTFAEAVEKNASMGLKWIEAYPGQRIGGDLGDAVLDHNMAEAQQQAVLAMLSDKGVTVVNYGVVGLPDDEAECRKVFDFAKGMGIETICSEPPPGAFEVLDKLVEEYEINVAIHNHPKPSRYWNYKAVLKATKGRSKRIGACADTGHWMRSGIDPLEALKALEGRIITFHLKDLNEFGSREAHDMPWGTGKGGMDTLLAEMKRQNFQGVFSIEYEHNWDNSVPDITQCVAYFDKTAEKLAKE